METFGVPCLAVLGKYVDVYFCRTFITRRGHGRVDRINLKEIVINDEEMAADSKAKDTSWIHT